MASLSSQSLAKYVTPVTVMLSFVSFWRASAIVLCDLGSSAYYVGGIAEKAIGKAAPWFILAIMLFSYAVRGVYIESCSMFVRGGVYRVVRAALGGTAAKFSVSALMFDYVLTGPISGVSAGLYLAALLNELGEHFHIPWMHLPAPTFAAFFAALVTLYFWYTNRVGVPFSSTRALRIMQATTVMVVMLIAWCVYTVVTKGFHPVPAPVPSNFHFNESALGWLQHTALPSFTIVAVFIGLGHSVLALSGEETLAQVYREIAAPKQKNLLRTGFIVFLYSMLFTSLVSFFAVMLIPDAERVKYLDDLIGGLSMFLAGPFALRLAFHGFVVLIGVLILAGAVNTAIIGSNGVLSRVAEDGVLPPWFRQLHPRYGTAHNIINVIVGLQLLTILLSRGNVDMLGEAYAFGVVWSFAMKGLAVVVLRFTHPEAKRWRFPLNFRIGRTELPLGLLATTGFLFLMAIVNLFTKKAATISGVAFTVLFFLVFTLSERRYASKQAATKIAGNPDPDDPFRETSRERFRLQTGNNLSPESLQLRAGCAIGGIKEPDDLRALEAMLASDTTGSQDMVVICIRHGSTEDPIEETDDATQRPNPDRMVDDHVTDVFSEVVFSAEKTGKPVKLLALAGDDCIQILLAAAAQLGAANLWIGCSRGRPPDQQEAALTSEWQRLGPKRRNLCISLVGNDKEPARQLLLVA
jgi:amino acid transporter